jgi:hypothetical protein
MPAARLFADTRKSGRDSFSVYPDILQDYAAPVPYFLQGFTRVSSGIAEETLKRLQEFLKKP